MRRSIYYLIIVIVIIQTATLLNGHTAWPIKHKARFAETTTNTRASAVGGRIHASGNASWTTVYVFCIRRTLFWNKKQKNMRKKLPKQVISHTVKRRIRKYSW